MLQYYHHLVDSSVKTVRNLYHHEMQSCNFTNREMFFYVCLIQVNVFLCVFVVVLFVECEATTDSECLLLSLNLSVTRPPTVSHRGLKVTNTRKTETLSATRPNDSLDCDCMS